MVAVPEGSMNKVKPRRGRDWRETYGMLGRELADQHWEDEDSTYMWSLPGTTSRASMASLYSMKPKPFLQIKLASDQALRRERGLAYINLISVISPVPWVLKWFSTSALVAVSESGQRCQVTGMCERASR